jgi:hypothetical protein
MPINTKPPRAIAAARKTVQLGSSNSSVNSLLGRQAQRLCGLAAMAPLSRALLNPKAADQLAELGRMFGSDHDCERAAAQHLNRFGLSRHEVIRAEAHWRSLARTSREHSREFDERECQFIANMTRLRSAPSKKQLDWLLALFERIGGAR